MRSDLMFVCFDHGVSQPYTRNDSPLLPLVKGKEGKGLCVCVSPKCLAKNTFHGCTGAVLQEIPLPSSEDPLYIQTLLPKTVLIF